MFNPKFDFDYREHRRPLPARKETGPLTYIFWAVSVFLVIVFAYWITTSSLAPLPPSVFSN